MLPSLLVPGPLPMHHTILGAGLLEKGIITHRLCTGWVVWRTRSNGGPLSPGFTLKFWGDKWRVRKDWLWEGRKLDAEVVLSDLSLRSLSLLSPRNAGERLMPGLLFGFPMSQRRMEELSRHHQECFDHCRPLCRVGSGGEELGTPVPFRAKHLDDRQQVTASVTPLTRNKRCPPHPVSYIAHFQNTVSSL